jgi:aminoglycoside phosphotransferase (APT) family kinase protein
VTAARDAPASAPGTQDERRALVSALLRAEGELRPGEDVVAVRQLEGGWSRFSHIATARLRSGDERRYVVRVKAPAALFDTDLVAEYRVLAALSKLDLPTPRVFGLRRDEDNPFGGQLFVMDHLPGTAPNVWRAADNAALRADWEGPRGIARDTVTYLARIHSLGADRAPDGLPAVAFADAVRRWRGEYEDAALGREPVLEEAFAWLDEHEPAPRPSGLVHGDFRAGNLLVRDGRVTGILDWELAYLGDVRFDVGYLAMPYIAGKHLRAKTDLVAGVADAGWLFAEYERLTGAPLDRDAVRAFSVLGAVALTCMTYTGARRHLDGRTTDVRRMWARFALPGLREDLTRLMQW